MHSYLRRHGRQFLIRMLAIGAGLLCAWLAAPHHALLADTVIDHANLEQRDARFPVSVGGAYGYIDGRGKIVIAPQFLQACEFTEDGIAKVRANESTVQYIDVSGRAVLETEFGPNGQWGPYGFFHEGRACVLRPDFLRGYVDLSGKVIVRPQYDFAEEFIGGVAQVGSFRVKSYWLKLMLEESGLEVDYAYIDRMGRRLGQKGFNADGAIDEDLLLPMKKDGKWGYINLANEFVIPPAFDTAKRFSEGRAIVTRESAFGVIDSRGRFIVKPTLAWIRDFHAGLAAAAVMAPAVKDADWGVIDRDGHWVIKPSYADIGNFSCGVAPMQTASRGPSKSGYIDRAGRVVVPPRFDDTSEMKNGAGEVWLGKAMGYIRPDGSFLWEPSE